MSREKYDRDVVLTLLREKKDALASQGTERLPQRSDFTEEEVVAVKAYFGPWPRALEAAGLKPPRPDDRALRNKEKRLRAKRRRSCGDAADGK